MVEHQRTAIAFDDISDDREAKAATGLRFVCPKAPTRQILQHSGGAAGSVVLDQEANAVCRARVERDAPSAPLAGVVEQVSEELEQLLAISAELCVGRYRPTDVERLVRVDGLQCAHESIDLVAQIHALAR